MESNELKDIDIKNGTCYCFNDIIKIEDFDFDNILIDEKSLNRIRIRYLINQKDGITYVFSHNYAKIKIDSYDSLPQEKTLILRSVIILMSGLTKLP